ncbi:hypothetical protein GCM10010182_41930 [Actinomadura cremea]|nr:hypothetical protein GCM10010182_41930 [Actinomadura cremea]
MSGKRTPLTYVPPEVGTRVVEQLTKGSVVKAVAEVRQATGWDLVSAKRYVDALRLEWMGARVPVELEERLRALLVAGRAPDAVKAARKEAGLGRSEAKDFVKALQGGWRRGRATVGNDGTLAERAREFVDADDRASAVGLVRSETGMNAEEAGRFVDALD